MKPAVNPQLDETFINTVCLAFKHALGSQQIYHAVRLFHNAGLVLAYNMDRFINQLLECMKEDNYFFELKIGLVERFVDEMDLDSV